MKLVLQLASVFLEIRLKAVRPMQKNLKNSLEKCINLYLVLLLLLSLLKFGAAQSFVSARKKLI